MITRREQPSNAKNKYRADLSIDKNNIDEEILKQAQLYYEWAQLSAEAEVEKDEAKEDYDIALIDIENQVRTKPEQYFADGESMTEGAIKTKVNAHPRIMRLRKRQHEALKAFKLLRKAEKAFEQRKSLLESYLYHYHRMLDSEIKVPKTSGYNGARRHYDQVISRNTSRRIKEDLQQKRSVRE